MRVGRADFDDDERVAAVGLAELAQAHAVGAGRRLLHVLDDLVPADQLVVRADLEPDKLFRRRQRRQRPRRAVAADPRGRSERAGEQEGDRRRGTATNHQSRIGQPSHLHNHAATLSPPATRMDAVQAPIIPIIGRLIREVPGTISLGQGVVHYGPPPAALDAVQRRARRRRRPTNTRTARDCRRSSTDDRRKLARRERHRRRAWRRIMVTAGANMAFMHAVLATTMPGDEVILRSRSTSITRWRSRWPAAVPSASRPTSAISSRLDAHRARRSPPARAPSSRSRRTIRAARCCRERVAARAERSSVASAACFTSATRPTNTSPTAAPSTCRRAPFPDASGHTISMYSLSKAFGFAGWRIGYMVVSRAAGVGDDEESGHHPHLPADRVAGRGAARRWRSAAATASRTCASWRRSARSWSTQLSALAPLARVPAADGAFYCLLKVDTDLDPIALGERLIREHKVAVIPGPAFGMTDGCYFRVAYGALQKATGARKGSARLVERSSRLASHSVGPRHEG